MGTKQNKNNKECFKKECENIKDVKNKLVISMIVSVLKFSGAPQNVKMTVLTRRGQLDINNSSACLVPQNLHALYYSDSESRKERRHAQISHLIVSTVSMCCCICFVSKCQYYMKLAVTEFCQISSVWGFHRCLCP